jgi:hypothetical protein
MGDESGGEKLIYLKGMKNTEGRIRRSKHPFMISSSSSSQSAASLVRLSRFASLKWRITLAYRGNEV